MDIEAPEAGIPKCLRVLFEKHGVGSEGQIADTRYGAETLYQARQVPADQRLAAGDTEFVDPKRGGNPNEVLDLFVGQDVLRSVNWTASSGMQ